MLARGISREAVDEIFADKPTGYSAEQVDAHMACLQQLGFTDPLKLITTLPATLGLAPDSIRTKLDNLRTLGFTNPIALITAQPTILSYAPESIRTKLDNLRALGFTDPVKLITAQPTILRLAPDSIRAKVDNLRTLGFANPIKLITTQPAILGYAPDSIETKIEFLRTLGFADPIELIITLPSILGLAPDSIQAKVTLLNRLFAHYQVQLTATEVIAKLPTLLSAKNDKLWTIARIFAQHAATLNEVEMNRINAALFAQLPLLVEAHLDHPDAKPTDFRKLIAARKKEKPDIEAVRQRIAAVAGQDPVARRYIRGYPLKAKGQKGDSDALPDTQSDETE